MTDINIQEKKMLSSALRYLKYRFRTKNELSSYLNRKYPSASDQNIQNVIGQLEKLNFIDDERFTQEWISSQLRKGKGLFIIKKQLAHMGVSNNIISYQTEEIDQNELVIAAKDIIIKKKSLFNKLNNRQKKYKIMQYLFSRGFSTQVIRMVIDDQSLLRVK